MIFRFVDAAKDLVEYIVATSETDTKWSEFIHIQGDPIIFGSLFVVFVDTCDVERYNRIDLTIFCWNGFLMIVIECGIRATLYRYDGCRKIEIDRILMSA